jgi:hypothetical protein
MRFVDKKQKHNARILTKYALVPRTVDNVTYWFETINIDQHRNPYTHNWEDRSVVDDVDAQELLANTAKAKTKGRNLFVHEYERERRYYHHVTLIQKFINWLRS